MATNTRQARKDAEKKREVYFNNYMSQFCILFNESVEVEKTEKRTNFVPPTIEEVEQAFFEKTKDRTFSHETAVKWWNFYNSKGWFVGKNKMKSWKSAIVTWLKTDQIAVTQPVEIRDFDDNGNFIGF